MSSTVLVESVSASNDSSLEPAVSIEALEQARVRAEAERNSPAPVASTEKEDVDVYNVRY